MFLRTLIWQGQSVEPLIKNPRTQIVLYKKGQWHWITETKVMEKLLQSYNHCSGTIKEHRWNVSGRNTESWAGHLGGFQLLWRHSECSDATTDEFHRQEVCVTTIHGISPGIACVGCGNATKVKPVLSKMCKILIKTKWRIQNWLQNEIKRLKKKQTKKTLLWASHNSLWIWSLWIIYWSSFSGFCHK